MKERPVFTILPPRNTKKELPHRRGSSLFVFDSYLREPLINSATHLHASALSSHRRQILDVAPLRLRFVSSIDTVHLRKSGRLHFISVSLERGDDRALVLLVDELLDFLGSQRLHQRLDLGTLLVARTHGDDIDIG